MNYKIKLRNNISELEHLAKEIENIAIDFKLDIKAVFRINLVLDELVTNIISYGYNDDKEHWIEIDFIMDDDQISIIVTDNGAAFNPLISDDPDVTKNIEEREIGGLGIYFVKKEMRNLKYERKDNKNILYMEV